MSALIFLATKGSFPVLMSTMLPIIRCAGNSIMELRDSVFSENLDNLEPVRNL